MKKLIAFSFSVIAFLSLALPTFAMDADKLTGHPCLYAGDVVTIACIPILFANIIYWLLILSGTVALFFVIFGGFKLLTSGGDAKNVEGARKTITWALIGLVVVLFSFGIVAVIAELTGVRCITRFGFSNCGRGTPENGGGECSRSNPSAPCPGGRACTRINNSSTWECRFPCNTEFHSRSDVYCPRGTSCQQVAIVPGVSTWRCEACNPRGGKCSTNSNCCGTLKCRSVSGSSQRECRP